MGICTRTVVPTLGWNHAPRPRRRILRSTRTFPSLPKHSLTHFLQTDRSNRRHPSRQHHRYHRLPNRYPLSPTPPALHAPLPPFHNQTLRTDTNHYRFGVSGGVCGERTVRWDASEEAVRVAYGECDDRREELACGCGRWGTGVGGACEGRGKCFWEWRGRKRGAG